MRSLIARLLAFAPGTRRPLAGLVALGLCVTATYVVQGILIARVLGAVFAGDDVRGLLGQVAGIAVLQAVRALLLARRDAWGLEVSGTVKSAVRERLARRLFELGPGALQRTRGGSMQSTAVDSVEHLDALIGRFVPQVAVSVLGGLAVTSYVVVLDPLVGVILLVCASAHGSSTATRSAR